MRRALFSSLALSGRQLARDRWHLSEAESGAESAGEREREQRCESLSFVFLCLFVVVSEDLIVLTSGGGTLSARPSRPRATPCTTRPCATAFGASRR